MEMVAVSSSELETLESLEIERLNRKAQKIWTIELLSP